ncbi:hypothetical protein GCM10011609_06270 [Lentzea pudingi]|uniref:HTH luxR-type domain-containing protein n=2 Tax=Lentzea pudingi TaxID=1789439 RepID=A0ABQ2HCY9_9PSEU|nr:hypothetical protein GCM10011609_06270 [Lentzea pudingi]
MGNLEIAGKLHLGATTVKSRVASLMAKTKTDNRIKLALLARGLLIEPRERSSPSWPETLWCCAR